MISCTTERMFLRELQPEDRDEYLRVHQLSREHFFRWFPEGTPEELFQRELEKAGKRGAHLRLVAVAPDERFIGFFSLSEIVRGAFQSAYASWAVSSEFVGRGFGTEGVQGLLDVAFSDRGGLGLHRAQANIVPSNRASIRVAEKVGFRREGLAERYLRIAGRWQDHVMYAKTVEEHEFRFLEVRSAP